VPSGLSVCVAFMVTFFPKLSATEPDFDRWVPSKALLVSQKKATKQEDTEQPISRNIF
jgi:hypothetical protein